MKNFLVCIVFLLFSCSTDPDNVESSGTASNSTSTFPENRANPYDRFGKEYYELLSSYSKRNETPHSLEESTKQIQFISKEFVPITDTKKASIAVTTEHVNWIMSNPQNSLTEIIEVSDLGTDAKLNLINFLKALIQKNGQEYVELYDYIVSYEATILESTILNADEKESILTVSSVSRYALYIDPNHDRDWEISVANRKTNKVIDSYTTSIVSVIALLKKLV
jgi:hypothetical protein